MKQYVASHLKDMNRQIVYNLILERGTTSKAEISKLTGISTPTVLKIISYLIKSGLVLEIGEGESSIGRKPQLLTLNRDLMYTASFFLEGEFLTHGIVDIVGNVEYKRTLRCEPSFEEIVKLINTTLIEEMFADAGISQSKMMGIGIALPGVYDPEQQQLETSPRLGITRPTYIGDALRALSEKYGVRVWVENDTNAQCFGEFRVSRMNKNEDLIFVSVGTGIGAGLILNGKLRRGPNYVCGEIGSILSWDDLVLINTEPNSLEGKVSYGILEDKYGINVDTDFSKLPDQIVQLILDNVSTPLVNCINNCIMFLDCNNVRIGGIVVDLLGDELVAVINQKLSRMSLFNVQVQRQTNEDIGLIGIAAMLAERRALEILSTDN